MSFGLWLVILSWGIGHCTCKCPHNVLLMYRMVLHAEWSEKTFPKQYPDYRPHAQWSVVVGRSHDERGTLWRQGLPASDALKQFAETGGADLLLRGTKKGVFSEFYAPPLNEGVGDTAANFFADYNHHKVSIVCRIIPSPDWFIGLDSFDLCQDGRWVESIKVDLWPLDAGTDDGYTFTAPNWASQPRANITQISSQYPNHLASSFYYPEREQLPRIAAVTFVKQTVYLPMVPDVSTGRSIKSVNGNSINDLKKYSQKEDRKIRKDRKRKKAKPGVAEDASFPAKGEPDQANVQEKKQYLKSKSCRVGEWLEWGPCSNPCGFGDQVRRRRVARYASRSGRPCPPLEESRWCKSLEGCQDKTTLLFKW